MNQATYKLRKNNIGRFRQTISATQFFWGVTLAIILFLYTPLFFQEYSIRQDQIKRGIAADAALPVLGSDSAEYAQLAQNLAMHGTFSLDEQGAHPETFRTIGYPGLLALYLKRGLPLAAFPLIQMVMVLLTSYAIFLMGKKWFSTTVGFLSAVFFMLDPVTIVNTLTIVTDIFYIFLLIYAIYFFFFTRIDMRFAWALGGILLGLSTLVRPISMYLLAFFILSFVFKKYSEEKHIKSAVLPIILCLVVYTAVLLPWVIRNKEATGVYGISTVKSYNIYHYYIPEFLSYKERISPDAARTEVGAGLGQFDERSLTNASKMMTRAKEYLLRDPLDYTLFHGIKTIPFFMSSGIETLYTGYNDTAGVEFFPTIKENLTSLILSRNYGAVYAAIKANPSIAAEQVILLGLWLLALLSISIAYKRKELFKVLFLWLIILYFAVLTGPVAYSRYRLPATPFLFLLATYAIVIRSYAPPHNYAETR